MSSPIIIIDDDDEEQAGPSTRSSAGTRKRQRPGTTPTSRKRLVGSRPAHVSNSRTAPIQQSEAVIDLTSHSPEDAFADIVQPKEHKQSVPAIPKHVDVPKPSAEASEPQCPVCMESMTAMACGPCGHVFCDPCIRAAVKAQKKCPTCRKTMVLKAIHRVYLDRR